MKVPASKAFYIKLLERVFWTAVQAGLAIVSVEGFDIPTVWVAPIAAVLAVVKGFVARKVGNSNEPATLPYGI